MFNPLYLYLPEKCFDCIHSNKNNTLCLIYGVIPRANAGIREQFKDCFHYTEGEKNIEEVGEKMKNTKYRVELNSYDGIKNTNLSSLEIACTNYETFKKIVNAVLPILEEEDIDKQC